MTRARQQLATAIGITLVIAAILVIGVGRRQNGEDDPGRHRAGNHRIKTGDGAPDGGHRSKSSRPRNPREGRTAIYSGPDGLAGWIQEPGSTESLEPNSTLPWEFVDGKLVSSAGGGIAREIATPPRSKISFKLEWSNSLRFRLLWAADRSEGAKPDNAFDLVMQRRFVYLRKRWMQTESGGSRIVGQANVAALSERQEALFELFLDRELGLISLYINGERAHDFFDKDPGVGAFGDWLQFVAEDFYPVQVSGLLVQSWSGIFPDGQRAERLVDEQVARSQRIASLKPATPWAPEVEYREAMHRAARLEQRAARAGDPEAAAEALRTAQAEAKQRLDEATKRRLVAKPDPERPGHVINPYTGQSLDVRGARGRVRDPNDPDPEHTFWLP